MTTATEYAAGLRGLADWLEAHPNMACLDTLISGWGLNSKAEAAEALLALPNPKKEYADTLFTLKGNFGPVQVRYVFQREEVCTARVVGKKMVPSIFIAEHEEDVIEWDCHPILGAAANQGTES